jgi:hypothetical protein
MPRKYLFPIIGSLIILIVVVGFFVISSSQSKSSEVNVKTIEETISKLSPGEIGLEMIARADKKAVKLRLNKASDIAKIEFDLVYEADLAGGTESEGEGRITRNVTDELLINGKSPFETKFYDLGSCSSNRCRYDTGVTEVQVVMKVTKINGKIYQVEDSLSL